MQTAYALKPSLDPLAVQGRGVAIKEEMGKGGESKGGKEREAAHSQFKIGAYVASSENIYTRWLKNRIIYLPTSR